jgi:molybdenum cofactor sulfurtransferase
MFILWIFQIFKQKKRRRETKITNYVYPHHAAALERKREFLSKAGDSYGYTTSECGHVDSWRPRELPNLICPLETPTKIPTTDACENKEVYLDYAGSALPTSSQLSNRNKSTSILANPHSTGPAASRTLLFMEQAKERVMTHFDCHPGRFAGLKSPPSECDARDLHPGYDIVWTSGATESLRIVSERFPWTCQSTLVYAQNSHTSVIGMRGPALAKGASFQSFSLREICSADCETIEQWTNLLSNRECHCCQESTTRNLLAFPLQCNFGGDKANASQVIKTCRKGSNEKSPWYTMLDLAKASSTDPINLKELDPDFACISFYKLFGEPTGLGALFVKRSAVDILTDQRRKEDYHLDRYFGGGSVDAVLSGIDFAVRRTAPLASLSNGSVHFRGIASLVHGFNELDRVGGMEQIQKHTSTLAAELVRRLKALRHGNGHPAIVLYGAWSKLAADINLPGGSLPGPTIAFNVMRDDGSFVGYNEVSKLAGLNRPPLQLRTGCFCNPGACQAALEQSDDEIQNNYLSSHHVCGDHIDIINEKPTGAIRASFGKDSIWEDLDSLVMFLAKNFVNEGSNVHTPIPVEAISEVKVSEMYIFPIKSCSAQRVDRWMMHCESGKLGFDREFALVDSFGTAMRLQSCPRMSLLKPTIDLESRTMTVRAPGCSDLVILLDGKCPASEDSIVKVCGNKCGGRLWGDLATSDWFSSFLGVRCWLARHVGDRYEVADSRGGVAFANEAPLLLLSQHSVETLNKVLVSQGQKRVNAKHFRPNLVVRASSATVCRVGTALGGIENSNPEDCWTKLKLVGSESLELSVVGQCARCSMVDVDPATGTKQKTLRALADYRRRNGQITFGVFLRSKGAPEETSSKIVWVQEGDTMKCT